MTATTRRAVSTVLLALLLAVAGAALSLTPAHASARPVTAGSAPPGAPTASVGVLGEHYVKFCVTNFKPHSTVRVENTLTHQVVYIHTNAKGAGCVEVPIRRGCKAITQTIVGTGTGADGKPARVSATVTVPATPSYCAGAASSGGTLPFTGADLAGVIIAGLLLVAVGTGIVTVVRRRHADATVG